MPREAAYGLTVSTTRVCEFAWCCRRQANWKAMPWSGVATDFQPSYALEAPGVTRDELVVRFDLRSPTAPSAARAAAQPCPRFASRVSRAVVVAAGLERGHSLHARPT